MIPLKSFRGTVSFLTFISHLLLLLRHLIAHFCSVPLATSPTKLRQGLSFSNGFQQFHPAAVRQSAHSPNKTRPRFTGPPLERLGLLGRCTRNAWGPSVTPFDVEVTDVLRRHAALHLVYLLHYIDPTKNFMALKK